MLQTMELFYVRASDHGGSEDKEPGETGWSEEDKKPAVPNRGNTLSSMIMGIQLRIFGSQTPLRD